VLTIDSAHDLALLNLTTGTLPPVSFYTGSIADGAHVVALGYPGNVDLATSRSFSDYVTPRPPTRSEGNYSNVRQIDGVDVLLHTASIGRGNSGGPLLDQCGRVLGVNTYETRGDEGDARFGFAISGPVVTTFLHEAGQRFSSAGTPCVSMADRAAAEQQAAIASADQERTREIARERARTEADTAAQEQFQQSRDRLMVVVVALSIFGAAGLATGAIFLAKNRPIPALVASFVGAGLVIAGVTAFWSAPIRVAPTQTPASDSKPETGPALAAHALCTINENQSRIIGSVVQQIALTWSPDGCINGRTQYARNGDHWRRTLVPHGEQTVSLVDIDPLNRQYVITRYFLSASDMAAVRQVNSGILKACTSDLNLRSMLARQQQDVLGRLPSEANEKLVYKCTEDPLRRSPPP
jgi:hypothetical protein